MTDAEYLALPEEKPYLEYVGGVVLQKAVPSSLHRRIVFRIDAALFAYIETHGGDAGPEGRVRLPNGSYRLPDTAYWKPGIPSGDDTVPTLVVEVRSPGEPMRDQREKCRQFREAGVEVCWLIDPQSRVVEVFEDEQDGEPVDHEGALMTSRMPEFAVPLAELWAAAEGVR